MMSYSKVYEGWKADPEAFWMETAEAIDWVEKPSRALNDDNAPLYEWFTDAKVNGCYNAVDRHVEAGNGDRLAIIYDSPITGTQEKITFADLQTRVASLAGALAAKGIEKGDRVIIYMPMVPQALEAMLACARLGAVHSVVFGGFAAHELAVRIEDCKPKAIIAASCGIEPGRVVDYNRSMMGQSNNRSTSLSSASSSNGKRPWPSWSKAVTWNGTPRRTAWPRLTVCRLKAITRPMCSTPLAPPVRQRVLCGQLQVIWWR